MKFQIIKSKEIIEEKLGVNCNYFAYPNGDYTDFSNQCVIDAGYKLGFTTRIKKLEKNTKFFYNIPRMSVPYNINTFKIYINLYPKK